MDSTDSTTGSDERAAAAPSRPAGMSDASQWTPFGIRAANRGPGFVMPTLRARLRDEDTLIRDTLDAKASEITSLAIGMAEYEYNTERFHRDAEMRALL